MKDKVAIFIDAGYFNKIAAGFGVRVDFGRLSHKICSMLSSDIYRTYYYDCRPYQGGSPTGEERSRMAAKQSFFHRLSLLPFFQVRVGSLARSHDRPGAFEQKGVDVLLSIDLVLLASRGNITKAVLISGDSDFVPAVETAKMLGVQVYLFHGGAGTVKVHNELCKTCDERVVIGRELLEDVQC